VITTIAQSALIVLYMAVIHCRSGSCSLDRQMV